MLESQDRRVVRQNCGDHKDVVDRLEWGNAQFKTLTDGQQDTHRGIDQILQALRGDDLSKSGGIVGHLETIDSRLNSFDVSRITARIETIEGARVIARLKAIEDAGMITIINGAINRLEQLERIVASVKKLSGFAFKAALVLIVPALGACSFFAWFMFRVWMHIK
jgi:hypothetical protein